MYPGWLWLHLYITLSLKQIVATIKGGGAAIDHSI